MYGTHYERSKREAIRSALAAPTPDSFPEIELTPPPGAPTPEQIRAECRDIQAGWSERERLTRAGVFGRVMHWAAPEAHLPGCRGARAEMGALIGHDELPDPLPTAAAPKVAWNAKGFQGKRKPIGELT
jgi:hypothetical protein